MAKKVKKALKKKAVAKKKKPASKKKVAVKKAPAKKKASKKVVKTTKPAKTSKPIGKVTHYYTSIKVAIIKFNTNVRSGTTLRFKGATTDFSQIAKSMQYDHKPIVTAPKGKLIGIKLGKRVREGDAVYKA